AGPSNAEGRDPREPVGQAVSEQEPRELVPLPCPLYAFAPEAFAALPLRLRGIAAAATVALGDASQVCATLASLFRIINALGASGALPTDPFCSALVEACAARHRLTEDEKERVLLAYLQFHCTITPLGLA